MKQQRRDPKVDACEKMMVRDHSTVFRQWQKDVMDTGKKKHTSVSMHTEEGVLPF